MNNLGGKSSIIELTQLSNKDDYSQRKDKNTGLKP